MSRGYDGKPIFAKSSDKRFFLDLLASDARAYRIHILAYCILDNHYHLVLENNSGRMSDFFKQMNGQYATYYRKKNGGRGYLFQDRFKSMLIQDDPYLLLVIAYTLNNPVRAGLVASFSEYEWSSGRAYFSGEPSQVVDAGFVEGLFGSRKNMESLVANADMKEVPVIRTEMGLIIGGEEFVTLAHQKFERRSGRESRERKRSDDFYFEPVEKVMQEFAKKIGMKTDKIHCQKHAGKRLRAELLVNLKERAGLAYREIAGFDEFSDVRINTLGSMYKRAKEKLAGEE